MRARLLGLGVAGTAVVLFCLYRLLGDGLGVEGGNNTVGWGFDVITFAWWLGIANAGTLISAGLLLLQQGWRTRLNRAAEAMTLFAVVCALAYPAFHTGRPWFDGWMLPYPSTLGIGPQFKSPLLWSLFGVGAYAAVSLVFFYVGLIPDLATLRDRSSTRAAKVAYGIAALGWRGSGRHWAHWKVGYLLLAALATPLVLCVQSVVSLDFAVSHTTLWAPCFVASGMAMLVLTTRILGLKSAITDRHFDNLNKLILLGSLIVTYVYAVELFMAWYSGNAHEQALFFHTRTQGPYAFLYWVMLFCNCVVPQLFWIPKLRKNGGVMFTVAILVTVGMWTDRFITVVVSLQRDFLPSSWAMYTPTWVDLGLFAGSLAFFLCCVVLFLELLPSEAKELPA